MKASASKDGIYLCCGICLVVRASVMSSRAKAALVASCAISSLIIWGVHYQQSKEREVCTHYISSALISMHTGHV